MKKQSPLGYSPASYGYPTAPRTPLGARNGGGGSNLPSIFSKEPGGGLILQRPQSGLKLDVKGLNSTGFFLSNGARERPQKGLSSSDSTADRIRQVQKYHAMHTPRHHTSDGRLLHHSRGTQPVAAAESNSIREKGVTSFGGGALAPITRRQPSAVVEGRRRPGTLPPIGAESEECDSLVTVEEESLFGGLEAAGGDRENEDFDSVSDDSESDTDDEFLETDSEAPPSRPGFESDAEKSAEMFRIPFPDVNVSVPFPATLIQDHAQLNTEKYMAGTTPAGLSPRVNNIVRMFDIHGPLDKELLKQALNTVVNFHPLLSATFQRYNGQLYAQLPSPGSEEMTVELETPVMGHEQPEDLILNARRKIFNVNTNNDILSRAVSSPLQPQDRLAEGLPHAMSLTSVGETDFLNSADNSPTIEPANRNAPRRKVVSFAKTQAEESGTEDTLRTPLQLPRHSQLPALSPFVSSPKQERPSAPLIRARLVSKSSSKNTLVVSFPRVVCDFWSSCLFMQQLADVYGKLEKAVDYRPSLAARKMESQRQEVKGAYEREKKKNAPVRKLDAATRLLQKRNTAKKAEAVVACCLVPMVSPRLSFPQVAQREKQLVMMMSRDDLQGFWESAITATIRRERGLSRTKVVPPVRIPSGLGEKAPVSSYGRRPQTSRLRPLTASRARPATAKRQGGGGFGEAGFTRETLLGPTTKFHFIKIEDEVCEQFKLMLPESCSIPSDQQFRLFTLGAYLLMLGKCCRGWGLEHHVTRDLRMATAKGRQTLAGSSLQQQREGSALNSTVLARSPIGAVKPVFPDPLQQYKLLGRAHRQPLPPPQPIALGEGHSPKLRGERRGARLDVGSFLIGVEVSLRDCEPDMAQGLFGPLTNDVAIRVNLSSSETFDNLVSALSKSLQSANKHGHLPFAPVADEVGLMSGLPVKFSYLQHRDIIQMANPNTYFYAETAVGVVNQGLGCLGKNCLLTPLNSKMDDSCHLELILWESYDLNDSLAGGFRYQPQAIRPELVGAFGDEFSRLLALVASHPSAKLLDLVREIHPPFLSSRSRTRGRKG